MMEDLLFCQVIHYANSTLNASSCVSMDTLCERSATMGVNDTCLCSKIHVSILNYLLVCFSILEKSTFDIQS